MPLAESMFLLFRQYCKLAYMYSACPGRWEAAPTSLVLQYALTISDRPKWQPIILLASYPEFAVANSKATSAKVDPRPDRLYILSLYKLENANHWKIDPNGSDERRESVCFRPGRAQIQAVSSLQITYTPSTISMSRTWLTFRNDISPYTARLNFCSAS